MEFVQNDAVLAEGDALEGVVAIGVGLGEGVAVAEEVGAGSGEAVVLDEGGGSGIAVDGCAGVLQGDARSVGWKCLTLGEEWGGVANKRQMVGCGGLC